MEDIFNELKEKVIDSWKQEGFLTEKVEIRAKALSTEEAIGNPEHRDFPIQKGKEKLMQATFRGAAGQSFTDMYGDYEGTLEQVMEQKWIASWTAAAESWFDYRRTGLPALQPGKVVKRDAIPLRYYYGINEMDYNPINSQEAIELLETTTFSAEDGKNSAWSKMWVLQGTGKPY